MTELEKEILEACGFRKVAGVGYTNTDLNTMKQAAKVARKYAREIAEKAWETAINNHYSSDYPGKETFLKENNLI